MNAIEATELAHVDSLEGSLVRVCDVLLRMMERRHSSMPCVNDDRVDEFRADIAELRLAGRTAQAQLERHESEILKSQGEPYWIGDVPHQSVHESVAHATIAIVREVEDRLRYQFEYAMPLVKTSLDGKKSIVLPRPKTIEGLYGRDIADAIGALSGSAMELQKLRVDVRITAPKWGKSIGGIPNDCVKFDNANESGVAEEQADDAIIGELTEPADGELPVINPEGTEVEFKGKTYVLGAGDWSIVLRVLIEKPGIVNSEGWKEMRKTVSHPERIIDKLPEPLRERIDPVIGLGTKWLTLDQFAQEKAGSNLPK